jgi:predicted phage-related endonuclease
MKSDVWITPKYTDRRQFIGGSDARIIMGNDEAALARLWREKRGEVEPEDLSGNLIVQLGLVTEALNRNWFERNTGQIIECVQHRLRHPVLRWMGATLDGMVAGSGAVFEAKFMLPWSFSEEAAAEKHIAQLQHNMWVTNAKAAALSIITGGGKWVEIFLEHESAKAELKGLMPEDAKEAMGHGIRAQRSKSGAVSFDVLSVEAAHAPVQ